MAARMYSPEQKGKLAQLFTESIAVYREIEDLNEGLSDTIKAIAEELEVKPAVLKKAIKIAQKSNFGEVREDHETIEDLLATVGRSV